jgi:hypothetical protein
VGLDGHQATTVASVRDDSGRILARAVVPTEEVALLEFFGGLRGSVHVAFEEGTQAQWLHDLLSSRVHRVLVCDRRGEKKQGNEGDLVDADQLSQDLLRGALRAVYHGAATTRHTRHSCPARRHQSRATAWLQPYRSVAANPPCATTPDGAPQRTAPRP